MKVLIDGMTLSKGAGVSVYIENIIKYLPENYEIILLTNKYVNFDNIKCINIYWYNIFTRLFFEYFIISLYALYYNVDAIFIPKSYSPFVKTKPVISTIFDIIPMQRNSGENIITRLYWNIAFRSAIRFSNALIFPQNIIKKTLYKKYPFLYKKNIKIIFLGYDTYKKTKGEEKYILIPGTIKQRKNQLLAIDIAELIKNKYKDKEIIVIGRIDNKNIKKTIENMGIEIKGYITHNEMEYYMNNAFIVIYLSNNEGFSLPIAEALFLNKHVIASDIPVHRSIYKNSIIYYNFKDTLNNNYQRIINEIKIKKRAKCFTWAETSYETFEFIKTICK